MNRLRPDSKDGGKPSPLLVDLLPKERVGTAFEHPGSVKGHSGMTQPDVPFQAPGEAQPAVAAAA